MKTLYKFLQGIVVLISIVGCASVKLDESRASALDFNEEKESAKLSEVGTKSVAIKSEDKTEKKVIDEAPKSTVATGAVSKSAQAARTEFKKGHFDSAEALINKAIKEQPNNSDFYHNLGLIYLAKEQQREAILAFRKGLQANPQDAAIAAQLGSIYAIEKDYIKAEIALEVAAQKFSNDPIVMGNYAIALTANKKIDAAERIYEKAIKSNPSSHNIMLNYSIFLIDQKQKYKQGLDILNRLKFVGIQPEARNITKELENRAKAGLK